MTAQQEPLHDLDRRWTEAEVGGDTAALDGSRWRLAGLHLSPIAGAPPDAERAAR